MPDDVAPRDLVPLHDLVDQRYQRPHLRVRKGPIAPFMARIDDLYADAGRIDVVDAAPMRPSGMPGALFLIDHADDLPILRHDIMGGNLGFRARSEEHTSDLQSLMRISYAAFCWKKKKTSPPYNILT